MRYGTGQVLPPPSKWACDITSFHSDELKDNGNISANYDEIVPDLCIASADQSEHRTTLAICVEMYSRRRFKTYQEGFTSKGLSW